MQQEAAAQEDPMRAWCNQVVPLLFTSCSLTQLLKDCDNRLLQDFRSGHATASLGRISRQTT